MCFFIMDCLYHYTKFESFKKMLEHDHHTHEGIILTIFASSAYCMDDQTEMNFGYPFIKSLIDGYESMRKKISGKQTIADLLPTLRKWISGPTDKYYLPQSKTPFAISFSRKENNQYMWKEYGDNGKGVCLFFDEYKLSELAEKKKDTYLHDIGYISSNNHDLDIWTAFGNNIIKDVRYYYSIAPILKYGRDKDKLLRFILEYHCPIISASIKTEDFEKEREVRWIGIRDILDANVRIKDNGKQVSYIKIKIPIDCMAGITYGPFFNEKEDLERLSKKYALRIINNL